MAWVIFLRFFDCSQHFPCLWSFSFQFLTLNPVLHRRRCSPTQALQLVSSEKSDFTPTLKDYEVCSYAILSSKTFWHQRRRHSVVLNQDQPHRDQGSMTSLFLFVTLPVSKCVVLEHSKREDVRSWNFSEYVSRIEVALVDKLHRLVQINLISCSHSIKVCFSQAMTVRQSASELNWFISGF